MPAEQGHPQSTESWYRGQKGEKGDMGKAVSPYCHKVLARCWVESWRGSQMAVHPGALQVADTSVRLLGPRSPPHGAMPSDIKEKALRQQL